MSAPLDNTLVVDRPLTICTFWWSSLSLDMVQLSSGWLSQQCTFFKFYLFLSAHDSDRFCSLYGGTWDALLFNMFWSEPISSYLRPGLVLLHTSEWQLVHQTFGKEFNPDFLSTVILSYVKVAAVIIFDTVHQALITHTGRSISLWSQRY